MADDTPVSADGRLFYATKAIYRLTQQCLQAATLIVTKGPISPVTDVQSIMMRVAFNGAIREAVAVGRWIERSKNGSKEPPPVPRTRPKSQTVIVDADYLAENPGFDEDDTTDVIIRKEPVGQRLRNALEVLKRPR